MTALRLGLIGAGRWGKAYIRTIAGMSEATLAAVASANPETKGLVPAGCAVFADWQALVAAREVDAVIVATPPQLHAAMTTAALEAGKPVLVEKPFTMSLKEAESVAELARRQRLALMIEHTHLFAPAFRELVRRAPSLGRLDRIRSRGNAEGPFRADVPVLWDWGTHDVAMCVAVAGAPSTQAARIVERRRDTPNAETVAIVLSWEYGPVADILVSNITAPKRRSFELAGEEGSLIYDDLAPAKLIFQPPGGAAEAIPFASDLPLTVAIAAFVEAARRPPEETALGLAVEVVRLLETCERSIPQV